MLVASVGPLFAPDDIGAGVGPTQNTLAPCEGERLAASAAHPCAVLEVRPMLRAVLRIGNAVD